MGRHERPQKQLQMLYLGSSAELGALRRSMEAHGAITRTRVHPALDAVVADSTVPTDHSTLRSAESLNIPVLSPAEAITQFAAKWMAPNDPQKPASDGGRSGWSFRHGSR
ncbi:MAG TPA: hypothetical protein VGI84_06705 [Pseudonocardiaceae bacterium]